MDQKRTRQAIDIKLSVCLPHHEKQQPPHTHRTLSVLLSYANPIQSRTPITHINTCVCIIVRCHIHIYSSTFTKILCTLLSFPLALQQNMPFVRIFCSRMDSCVSMAGKNVCIKSSRAATASLFIRGCRLRLREYVLSSARASASQRLNSTEREPRAQRKCRNEHNQRIENRLHAYSNTLTHAKLCMCNGLNSENSKERTTKINK